MKTAALYARVSTSEQTAESQLVQLRDFAARRGLTVVQEFTDQASGATAARERQGLRELLAAAHRHEFDAVVFWKLDRLSREGIRQTLEYLERLEQARVEYYSATEPEITNAGPLGAVFVAIRSYFAQIEREMISERTRAGQERARRAGKTIGRPPAVLDALDAAELARQGLSLRQIARRLKSNPMTVSRRLARFKG